MVKLDPKEHHMKVWPEFFDLIDRGVKNFEVRSEDDRTFEVDDWVVLYEYNPNDSSYSGRMLVRKIGYILRGEPFVKEKWAILDLKHNSACRYKHHLLVIEGRSRP